ncbi:MAG TPA: type II secretion system F family protein [Planctomycetaceae bacterium]|nr:type II secretion system F family protein [Planctomycetaceae bacterium]
MFSPHIRTKSLVIVCRSLATMVDAGISIGKAFDLASQKSGDPRCRQAMLEIAADLRRGLDVTEAMRARGQAFPETMIELVGVAEQTGTLPEVLKSLAAHFENNIRLRRTFFSAISWPAFQLVAAILIVALMLYILGIIAQIHPGSKPIDVLGLGLYGAEGAITWLTLTFGSIFGALVAGFLIRRSLTGQKYFDSLMLQIPVLGWCLRSFAIARFSWAFALTQQAGMSIEPSLTSSFKATSNGAFLKASPYVWAAVREGETLHDALAETRLFPVDYLHIVDVAETSGTVPETLERLSPDLEAQARRALEMLASALAWLIWALVATFIIFLIFRIAMFYIGQLNDAVNMAK